MDLTGTIIAVMPAVGGVSQRSGNQWMKQEYVLEVPAQYPKRMAFTIFGEDRIKQFNLQQGEQQVTIQFDIDAHEHNGRWYNEIRAHNVLRQQQPAVPNAQPYQPPTAQQMQQAVAGQPFSGQQQEQKDDLPF